MVEGLRDYKLLAKSKRKIDIIDQIEINLKANRCLEPNHPTFPAIELLCKIHEIDIYFSDYVMANLMNIQKSLSPPPEPPKPVEQHDKFEKTNKKMEEFMKKAKAQHKHKHRRFDDSDDDHSKQDEVKEQSEDVQEESATIQQVNNIANKSDLSSKIEQSADFTAINKTKPAKIDQRILLFFNKMTITLGEAVSQDQVKSGKYEGIIDTHKSEIPHANILEMALEGIELEFNNGTNQNLFMVMSRLYVKDLQKVQLIRGNELQVSSLIPR